MKKWKIILSVLLANIIFFSGAAFIVTATQAYGILEEMKWHSEGEAKLILRDDSYIPIYAGGLNNAFVNQRIVNYIADLHCTDYSASYAVAMEDNNVIADPLNKLVFPRYGINYYSEEDRIIDFDKFFTDDEIKDMKKFFESNIGKLDEEITRIVCFGKMDDKYIYPTHIAIGNVYDEELTRENILINTDEKALNKSYAMLVYEIHKEYVYENEERLVDIDLQSYLHPDDAKEYIWPITFDSYCPEYKGDFEQVVTNVNKYKKYISENGTYERNSIFTYKKISSKQIEDCGHVITEYYSFVGKPFKQAIDECPEKYIAILLLLIPVNLFVIMVINSLKKNYYKGNGVKVKKSDIVLANIMLFVALVLDITIMQTKNILISLAYTYFLHPHIIIGMFLFNIFIIYSAKKIYNRQVINDKIASQIFFSVTDKLIDCVDELESINRGISLDSDKSDRELFDKEIRNLDGYIRDVIEWSKMQVGVLEIHPEEVKFGYLVEAVIKDVSKDTRIKIITNIDMNIVIEADLSRLAKAVAAFIRFVIRFSEDREAIYVIVEESEDKAYFKVSNNQNIKNLNRRAYKNKSKMLATFDMLLGKSYIRLHNGEHWYYDEEDEFTQYFAVPLKYIAKKKSKKDVNLKEIYGVIAHELKTPLNVMKLYNEALMIGNVSEEKIERYNLIIKTQLELIVNQVHEFVDSNYVSRGIVHPKKESVDLVEVINKTLDKYSVIMEDKELTANIEGVDKAEFISDATGVRSIVSNYINNAIKYSMVAETINISVEKDERFAIIKIANKVPENLRYNTEDKDKKVINRIERDGLGLIIARTYLDICKASYGCNYADDNVEYWFKFRIK